MAFDVAIVYRIYPRISKVPIVYADDKYRLSELALASFKASLGSLRFKMWAILDGCPPEYEELFHRFFGKENVEIIHYNKAGNEATFNRQMDILLTQTDADFVYFAEDDYVYRAGEFHEMIDFLRANPDADFVSPYDHCDYYSNDPQLHLRFHHTREYIRISGNYHWRTSSTSCLTFLARKTSLKEAERSFRTYARRNYDTSLWLALTKRRVYNPLRILHAALTSKWFLTVYAKAWYFTPLQLLFGRRYSLWSPMPSIATHLESTGIAPLIDWQKEFEKYGYTTSE